jgi:hypothetical protein
MMIDAVLPAMQVMEPSNKEIVVENKPKIDIKTTACQETEARQEEMKTSRRETAAVIEPETEVKTMAYRETTEERQEEKKPTSPDRKPEEAQKDEAPADDAEVMPVGEPKKKRRRDRKLAAEHCRQEPKCGPPMELAVAHRGMSLHATVARKTPIYRNCPVMQQWHDAKETS